MLDPTIMKQSRAHTRGSTLQNGIRHDAGGSEMASATTVFSLGKIDMTRRSLCYNTTLTSPYVPHSHRPRRSLAHQHIDNKCRGPSRHDAGGHCSFRYGNARGRRNGVTAAGRKPAPSE